VDGRYRSLIVLPIFIILFMLLFRWGVFVSSFSVSCHFLIMFVLFMLLISYYCMCLLDQSVYVVDFILLYVFVGSVCFCCCFLIVFLSVHSLFLVTFSLCVCWFILFVLLISYYCMCLLVQSVFVAVSSLCFCQFILCFLSLSHYVFPHSVHVFFLSHSVFVVVSSFCLFILLFPHSVHVYFFSLILFMLLFPHSVHVCFSLCVCTSWDCISRLKIHYCTKTIVFPNREIMNLNLSF